MALALEKTNQVVIHIDAIILSSKLFFITSLTVFFSTAIQGKGINVNGMYD